MQTMHDFSIPEASCLTRGLICWWQRSGMPKSCLSGPCSADWHLCIDATIISKILPPTHTAPHKQTVSETRKEGRKWKPQLCPTVMSQWWDSLQKYPPFQMRVSRNVSLRAADLIFRSAFTVKLHSSDFTKKKSKFEFFKLFLTNLSVQRHLIATQVSCHCLEKPMD